MPILGDGLKVGGLSLYVLYRISGDVTLAYRGLASAQDVLVHQGGSPDMIVEIVRSQLIDAKTKITGKRKSDPTSVLLGIWLFEHPVLYRLESADGFQPRECDGPEFAGHGGKELQRVFHDNLNSLPIGFRQRDKDTAELRGLPYDPKKPVEVQPSYNLALQAGRSVNHVNEMYRLRGDTEVGGKVQVCVITSDGIRKVGYQTLDTAGGRDVLEHMDGQEAASYPRNGNHWHCACQRKQDVGDEKEKSAEAQEQAPEDVIRLCCLTQRALDRWVRLRYPSIFLTSSFSRFNRRIVAVPPATGKVTGRSCTRRVYLQYS